MSYQHVLNNGSKYKCEAPISIDFKRGDIVNALGQIGVIVDVLQIDLRTINGERIIGEIKTTVPYSGARNDLGAKQKESFRHDFDKLNKTPANHKFFFVTDMEPFEVIQRRYASQIPGVKIVLLTSSSYP